MQREYVTGWDGVRAVAVIAVVAFHLEATWLPGGFLGVTTFLVLAGALATFRIGSEIEATGSFNARRYASGRIRRLIPALVVYVGAVLLWTWIDHPTLYATVAGDAVAALLYITPWREMTSATGYADAFSIEPEPLLHTWSLGVEEVAWVITGLAIALTRKPAAAAIVTGTVGLVGYLLWFGEADLYYSPARLGEFAIGAVLGVVLVRRDPGVGWAWGVGGAAVLGWLMATKSVPEFYDGWLIVAALASVAVVGAALGGPASTLLSVAPLRWIGTRSYSLYLWHLGLIELTELGTIGVLIGSAALSEVSYQLVENPIRRRRVLPRRAVPALLTGSLFLLAVSTIGPRPDLDSVTDVAADAIEAASNLAVSQAAAAPDAPAPADNEESADESTDGSSCIDCRTSPIEGAAAFSLDQVFTDADDPVRIAVLGDSTGAAMAVALDAWGRVTGEAIIDDLTVGGCSPLHYEGSGWYRTRISANDGGEKERESCMPTLADVGPDVDLLLIVEVGMPLLDHLRPDGQWVDLTDPAMAAILAERYRALLAETAARGLPTVVTTAAIAPEATLASMRDTPPVDAYNEILRASGLTAYDYTTPLVQGDYLRFDGVHLHVDTVLPFEGPARNEAHRYVAEIAGPALVAYARDSLTR